MEKFYALYAPFKDRIGNLGVIIAGLALAAASFFIRTDIFEAILDFVGIIGIVAGIAGSGAGIFMMGKDKGWWDAIIERARQIGNASPPPGQGANPYSEAPPPPYAPPAEYTQPEQQQPYPPQAGETIYPGGTSQPQPIEISPPEIEAGTGSNEANAQPPQPPVAPPYEAASQTYEPAYQQAITPRASSGQVIPKLTVLGILPAVFLLLSALPIVPWFSNDVEAEDRYGRLTGQYTTERDSLWDTFVHIREEENRRDFFWDTSAVSRAKLYGIGAAFIPAVLFSILNGAALLLYLNSIRHRRADSLLRLLASGRSSAVEEYRVFKDRLELFLVFGALLSFITLLSTLSAIAVIPEIGRGSLYGYERVGAIWDVELRGSNSLGWYLCVLAALSVIGYVVFLIEYTRRTAHRLFDNINLSTFFSFEGRIPRPTFCLITGVIIVFRLMPIFILGVVILLGIEDWIASVPSALYALVWLAIAWMWLAICIKRYHDRDKSGRWAILSVIPIIPTLLIELPALLISFLPYGAISWMGEPIAWLLSPIVRGLVSISQGIGIPDDGTLIISLVISLVIVLAMLIGFIWSMIELAFMEGTREGNRYGPPRHVSPP